MRTKVARIILLTLNACDGVPMPEASLISAVQLSLRVENPTASDVAEALKDVEAGGYAAGITEDLVGRSWTLTEKGKHKARQLR